MMMMMMMCWPGTVVYCLDADKKDVLVRINLVDSLPTTPLSPAHCASDKRKGFASFLCYNIVSYHNILFHIITYLTIDILVQLQSYSASCGSGAPSPFPFFPLSIYFLIFSPFYFFLSFLGFTYFLLLSIPSLSTRIVPLRFRAGGRRR